MNIMKNKKMLAMNLLPSPFDLTVPDVYVFESISCYNPVTRFNSVVK